MKPNNPFLVAGYHSPEYFCDRKEESRKISSALFNGRNVTLMAPRRMGKTGLIKNVFQTLKEQDSDIITIYLDIFATQNLSDFITAFASATLGKLDSSSGAIISRVTQFIKSCRPTFTLDEQSGVPTISIDVTPKSEQSTLKEIFDYLASCEKRCYIAIDEFQQIREYPENGVEAQLRSYIQFLPNVNFIFSGSKQHLMQDMFFSAKRPFYLSTEPLSIEHIDKGAYFDFASHFFTQQGVSFSSDSFNYMYDKFDGHTWYIQSILNRLYSYARDVDNNLIDEVIDVIVDEFTYSYEALMSAYTPNNITLLKAVATEEFVKEITSSSFISKYKLGAASSISASLKKLIDKELIYKTAAGYIVYDRFMAIWLRRQLF